MSVPHLALPFRLSLTAGATVNEQGSVDEVAQNVAVLLSTEVGSRSTLPTYGIEDPAFSQQVDTASMVQAITEWEPRANISIAAGIGPVAGVTVNVSVDGAPPQASVSVQVLPTVPPSALEPVLIGATYGATSASPPASGLIVSGGSAPAATGPTFGAGSASSS